MMAFAVAVWGLYGLPKPVVAAVSGAAVAGGCILALTADHRVLKRGAPIGLNEVKVGVPLPWSVTRLLRATVHPDALSRIALLGRNFTDEDAVGAGLVDEVAEAEGFEATCLARLEEYADKDPLALATTKAWLREGVLAEMMAQEGGRVQGFLDGWFSAGTQERIRATVASLRRRLGEAALGRSAGAGPSDSAGPAGPAAAAEGPAAYAGRRRERRQSQTGGSGDTTAAIPSARLASATSAFTASQFSASS